MKTTIILMALSVCVLLASYLLLWAMKELKKSLKEHKKLQDEDRDKI